MKKVKELEKIYEYRGSMRRSHSEETPQDKLFLFYIQELESKPRKQMPYLVTIKKTNEKKALATVIAETEAFFTPEWRDLMNLAEKLVNDYSISH